MARGQTKTIGKNEGYGMLENKENKKRKIILISLVVKVVAGFTFLSVGFIIMMSNKDYSQYESEYRVGNHFLIFHNM